MEIMLDSALTLDSQMASEIWYNGFSKNKNDCFNWVCWEIFFSKRRVKKGIKRHNRHYFSYLPESLGGLNWLLCTWGTPIEECQWGQVFFGSTAHESQFECGSLL